ncbi:acyltransferase family protein [Streptomyces kanamyceticus]|uniref:acyltransferase family protein n=1 Tax=Streptomyces kanamyceticus TaxID=1967 RepID=UPI0037DCBAC5
MNACFNTPSWPISCEVFFYALFPLLIAAARRLPARCLVGAWAALAVTGLALPLIALAVGGPPPDSHMPLSAESFWLCTSFPLRLAEFALGILTARLVRADRWPHVPRAIHVLLPVVAAVATPLLPPPFRFGALAALPLALVIVHLARTDILARPKLIALGEASYALYIIHWALLLAFRHALGEHRSFMPLWESCAAVCAVLAQSAALVVHRYFERSLFLRFSYRPPTAPPQSPESAAPPPM